ncbi:3-dehydroquinate synthase homolog [uncultured delta proteobacterium]|uniref:3-dehydroquinate synthase homolog n=1 Tax=uncultured delta proteobacterium TaxID=34034 RepID=A0A212K1D4_9DELT|nr:3-dehydroquinate synthase homolog [uncultured delta proteobacterium]
MRALYFTSIPYAAEDVTLALEGGATGLIVPAEHVATAASLARCDVFSGSEAVFVALNGAEDEHKALEAMKTAPLVVLRKGWEIIPVENLLAHAQSSARAQKSDLAATLALEVTSAAEAKLASGILEKGVDAVVVTKESLSGISAIAAALNLADETLSLCEAVITEVTPVGMGHRVCVDTLSRFSPGQGMLVGNSAAFTFLVNAETQHNDYVAPRPFRVNAGAVHAYALMPGDKTRYLEELRAGDDVLIVDHAGKAETAVIGRVKVEKRPMLLIKATIDGGTEGAIFLQNAETINLVRPGGDPVSVVSLAKGDKVLCRKDTAGRHFGIRITEDITEE